MQASGSASPILLVDIGNTSTLLAWMSARGIEGHRRYLRRNGVEANLAEACRDLQGKDARAVLLCSVVPELSGPWLRQLTQCLQCPGWQLTPGGDMPLEVNYPEPSRIGADRLANAIAALARVPAPLVVADFGTALTFDIVDEQGAYIGGVISPGVEMMYRSLGEKTALLPLLDPKPTDRVIGRSTEEAMHAGSFYGYRGMVREIVHEIQAQLQVPELRLLATGGFAAEVLRDFGEAVEVVPDLTLEGLALAWSAVTGEELYDGNTN